MPRACVRATGAPGLLREAIAIDPDFALAHAELGRALYLQPERETRLQAEQHYVKALGLLDRLTPRERLWITASAADSRGDRAGAVSGYHAYLERYPDETRAWFRLGWTLMAGLGNYAESTKAFERLVAVDPSDAGAHINLASSLAGLKRDAEAFAAYQRAFALDPALLTGQFMNHEYGFSWCAWASWTPPPRRSARPSRLPTRRARRAATGRSPCSRCTAGTTGGPRTGCAGL